MFVQEQKNLLIVVGSSDHAKNLNNNLKSYYFNPYYVNDRMPRYQFSGVKQRFTMAVGYANDLPFPEVRDDLSCYEGEYFYHLDDMLYLVENLSTLKEFKEKANFRPFDTAKLFQQARAHEVLIGGVRDEDFQSVVERFHVISVRDGEMRDVNTGEVIETSRLHVFFSLTWLTGLDMCVMVLNDQYVNNECWSTFHYGDVTGKTCFDYFETFKFRILNPIFRGVEKQVGKHTLFVKDELAVELFSFYTEIDWMPVCSVYRHREVLDGLMKRIVVNTPLPYRIDEEKFRIYVDVSGMMADEKSWLTISLDVGEFFTVESHQLSHEYVIVKSRDAGQQTIISPHSTIHPLEYLPPDGFTHFGR